MVLLSAPSLPQLRDVLSKLEGNPISFDFETHGNNPADPDHSIRCVSLRVPGFCVSVDFENLDTDVRGFLLGWLSQQELIAHNYAYDGAWLAREVGHVVWPKMCTYATFKMLATEGFFGQRWGLDSLMTDILGWPESGKDIMNNWLRETKTPREKMATAPFDILGVYNCQDSTATGQTAEYFDTVLAKFPVLRDFLDVDMNNLICLVIEQQLNGLALNLEHLDAYGNRLDKDVTTALQDFLNHPDVSPAVASYNQQVLADTLAAEPSKFKKDGEVTKRWLSWQQRCEEVAATNHFNTDSPQQLCWLFYEKLKFKVAKKTDGGKPSVDADVLPTLGEPGRLLAKYRDLRDQRKFVTQLQNVQLNGRLHPSLKVPATITSRLAGGLPDE